MLIVKLLGSVYDRIPKQNQNLLNKEIVQMMDNIY